MIKFLCAYLITNLIIFSCLNFKNENNTVIGNGFNSYAATENSNEISIIFNNNKLLFDSQPYIKDGRTMVPFRKIFEAFGLNVEWDNVKQAVLAKNEEYVINLTIGSKKTTVNGYLAELDVAPEIVNGRTFVPLRFVSEKVGAEVLWDNTSKTITIKKNIQKYKLGDKSVYKDIKMTLKSVDKTSSPNKWTLSGIISKNPGKILVEVLDKNHYPTAGLFYIPTQSNGDNNLDNFLVDIYVPSKSYNGNIVIFKTLDKENKEIIFAEYSIQ